MPHNPTRGYVDPASVEQHMMLGEMRGTKNYKPPEAQRLKVAQCRYNMSRMI